MSFEFHSKYISSYGTSRVNAIWHSLSTPMPKVLSLVSEQMQWYTLNKVLSNLTFKKCYKCILYFYICIIYYFSRYFYIWYIFIVLPAVSTRLLLLLVPRPEMDLTSPSPQTGSQPVQTCLRHLIHPVRTRIVEWPDGKQSVCYIDKALAIFINWINSTKHHS